MNDSNDATTAVSTAAVSTAAVSTAAVSTAAVSTAAVSTGAPGGARVFQPADVLNAELMGHETTMHGIFDYLREYDPVARVEQADYEPFWSLTKYHDIKFVGSKTTASSALPGRY